MYLDEFQIGQRTVFGTHTFTAEEIITFATAHDPQPFHLSEEAGRASHFGGLVASGWHTTAIWMKLNVAHRRKLVQERQARRDPVGAFGPSPGFRDLTWFRPVRPGDVLTFGAEVIETRASASRPGWGILTYKAFALNEKGEEVMTFMGSAFVGTRERAEPV